MATVFEPGDFVRLKTSPTGHVGVVSRVDPESTASVQVYWRKDPGLTLTAVCEPMICDLSLRKMLPSMRSN